MSVCLALSLCGGIIALILWALVKIAGDTDKSVDHGYHFEKIRCPNCKCIQKATVLHKGYVWDRTHKCVFCGYWIFASEWDRVRGVAMSRRGKKDDN